MTHPSSRCHRLINGRNVDLWNRSKLFASNDPVHFEQGGLIFKWPPGTIELKPILDYWWMCGFSSNVDSYIRHTQHIVLSITCIQYIYVYYLYTTYCVPYRLPVRNIFMCLIDYLYAIYCVVYYRLPVFCSLNSLIVCLRVFFTIRS